MGVPPGTTGRPLVGETHQFRADPLRFFTERQDRYGAVFTTRLFGRPTACFGAPDGTRALFRAERRHFVVRDRSPRQQRELFGRAVFSLTHEEHTAARQMLNPALVGAAALAEYAPGVAALCQRTVRSWHARSITDLHAASRELTLQVCARTLLGVDAPAAVAVLGSALDRFAAGTVVAPWTRWARPTYRAAIRAAAELRAVVGARIDDPAPPACVLSRLVAQVGAGPARRMLPDHMLALLIAARETTASLVTWLLIETGGDAARQDTVREEARAGLDAPATLLRPDAAPGLRQLLYETERCHSPNMIVLRRAVRDCEVAGYRIPAGWNAAYSPSANHFNAAVFPEPEAFRPERFAGARRAARTASPTDLLTFGQGMRACPGKPLAELVALAIAAAAVAGFHVTVPARPDRADIRFLPAKVPASPVPLRLSPVAP